MNLIETQDAICIVDSIDTWQTGWRNNAIESLKDLSFVQPDIIHCKDCRYFKSTTSIHGECECGEMWQSLFGETTEVEAINVHKDHYCGYAERKTDEYIN